MFAHWPPIWRILTNNKQTWPKVFVHVCYKVHTWGMHTFACVWPNTFAKVYTWLYLMPHLHIRTSSEANSKANNKRTNHIFALSFVASFSSPFVVLALKAVFLTRVKGDEWQFALRVRTCECSCMGKQFFPTEIEAYKCSCKWRGKARARMCKCGMMSSLRRSFIQVIYSKET